MATVLKRVSPGLQPVELVVALAMDGVTPSLEAVKFILFVVDLARNSLHVSYIHIAYYTHRGVG